MKNFGFTLAEVLITLGVIGIVAALTIPSLIQNHKKLSTAVRLKSFYSILSQAIKLSEINNGPSEQWTKEEMVRDENGKVINAENAQLALMYFNKYLKDYIKYIKVDENPKELQIDNEVASMIKVYLANGSSFYLNNGQCAHFKYDINGYEKPNKEGKDRFNFLLCPERYKTIYFANGNFGPYCGGGICRSREVSLSRCKENPEYCTDLIMRDGWEFNSDYPYKL